MTDEQPNTDSTSERTDSTRQWRLSRRNLLEAGAATGVIAGLGTLALGNTQQVTYRFGGRTSGWQGREPGDIADETNPTLELEAGTEYEVVWENLDGARHDFVILSEDGDTLAQTEITSEQGATRSLTFTASEEMSQYICTVHPSTMVGDIQVSGDGTATPGAGTATPEDGTATENGTPGAEAGFFEQGTEVGVEEVANGPISAPTDFAAGPEGTEEYFVADQTGQVWVVGEDGVREEPFIDVSDRMVELGTFYGLYASPDQEYDERGLLGIDFHPDFANNGRFYLHYSAPPTDELISINWDHIEVVSEFQVADDGETGDLESERPLLEIPSPQYNHDGGPMAFGPDGYLYVPMGDGGGADDDMYGHVPDWYDRNTGGNGQDLVHNMMGDVLRIDVDGGAAQDEADTAEQTETPDGTETPEGTEAADGTEMADGTATPEQTEMADGTETPDGTEMADGTETPEGTEAQDGGTADQQDDRPYGIPEDNPFAGEDTSGMDEIYAYGFRNPYGISFDSEGNLFVADAGQNLWEEVNVVERGGNYGWNVKEGTHCFSTDQPSDVSAITDCPDSEPDEDPYDGSELIDPVIEYPHVYQGTPVGVVVVGGHRYETDTISDLQGKYVFGEYNQPTQTGPNGRILAATPPENFGQDDGTEAEDGETATAAEMTETPDGDVGTETMTEDEVETQAGTEGDGDTETPMDDDVGTATPDKQPVGTETPADGTPDEGGPEIGPDDIPRDELWEMEELQVQGEFNYYVRAFGRGSDGEIYVLVSESGVPEEDAGAVLQLVPPEEGDTADGTETEADEEATETPDGEDETETAQEVTEADGAETETVQEVTEADEETETETAP